MEGKEDGWTHREVAAVNSLFSSFLVSTHCTATDFDSKYLGRSKDAISSRLYAHRMGSVKRTHPGSESVGRKAQKVVLEPEAADAMDVDGGFEEDGEDDGEDDANVRSPDPPFLRRSLNYHQSEVTEQDFGFQRRFAGTRNQPSVPMDGRCSPRKQTDLAEAYREPNNTKRVAEAARLRKANDDLRETMSMDGWWNGDSLSVQESKAHDILGRMDGDVDRFERGAMDLVGVLEKRLELREELRRLWRGSNISSRASSRASSTSGWDD